MHMEFMCTSPIKVSPQTPQPHLPEPPQDKCKEQRVKTMLALSQMLLTQTYGVTSHQCSSCTTTLASLNSDGDILGYIPCVAHSRSYPCLYPSPNKQTNTQTEKKNTHSVMSRAMLYKRLYVLLK